MHCLGGSAAFFEDVHQGRDGVLGSALFVTSQGTETSIMSPQHILEAQYSSLTLC